MYIFFLCCDLYSFTVKPVPTVGKASVCLSVWHLAVRRQFHPVWLEGHLETCFKHGFLSLVKCISGI